MNEFIFVFGSLYLDLCSWIFVLFHTRPHVGPNPHMRPSGITYMNIIIMRAAALNNLISFYLYFYNDKFILASKVLPHIIFIVRLSFVLSFHPFFLSYNYRTQQAKSHHLMTKAAYHPEEVTERSPTQRRNYRHLTCMHPSSPS